MMLSMEESYHAYAQTVYRYLLTLTHKDDIAEELTQETFYQAVKNADRFDGSCKVSTWLCGISKNVLQSYRRKHPVSDELGDAASLTSSAEADAFGKLSHLEILRKLHLLDGDMREVMYLRLLGDLSFREIGDILSRTENWARVTFYRGKEKLKKEIQSYEQ